MLMNVTLYFVFLGEAIIIFLIFFFLFPHDISWLLQEGQSSLTYASDRRPR